MKNVMLGILGKNKNKIKCHAEFNSASHLIKINDEILKQVQDDGGQCNGGFTLIELLVVVLIIGILAAVALPQYQKVVEKSKATQALTLLKSVGQAAATYYLTNGEAPKRFDELDVDIPAGWTGTEKAVDYDMLHDVRSNGEWSLQLYVSSETGRGVLMIGRLTGKYKGAGFWVNNLNTDNPLELTCTERRRAGVVFEQNEGDYCVKLFGATRVKGHEDATVQPYTMKW